MIIFVLSGTCPVGHRNLFYLSLRLVIFRLQSWYAHDVAQSQIHQLSILELELRQATRLTATASISICTRGTGAHTALAGSQDMARVHIWTREMGCIAGSHGSDVARVYL